MKVRTLGCLCAGTVVLAVACKNGWEGSGTTSPKTPASEDAGSAGETSAASGKGGTGSAGKSSTSDAGASTSSGGTKSSGHGGSSSHAGNGSSGADASSGGSSNQNSSGGSSGKTSGHAGASHCGCDGKAGDGSGGASGSPSSNSGNGGEAGESSPVETVDYVAVTYTFVADSDWDGLSVYQEARDGHGHLLNRPPPYGPEHPVPAALGTFAWRIARDIPGTDCSAQDGSTVTCTVHVPSKAHMFVNVDQSKPGLGLWACEVGGALSGTLSVKDADGNRLALTSTTDIQFDTVTAPCVFQFTAP